MFADSGWSSFGGPLLVQPWVLENIEVRDGDSPIASYSLDDRPGKLLFKIEDEDARQLTMSNPDHPAFWRDLPDSGDWAIQSDVELDTLQQGDFDVGLVRRPDGEDTWHPELAGACNAGVLFLANSASTRRFRGSWTGDLEG